MTRNKPRGQKSGKGSAGKRGSQKESLQQIADELGATLKKPQIERPEETRESGQDDQEPERE